MLTLFEKGTAESLRREALSDLLRRGNREVKEQSRLGIERGGELTLERGQLPENHPVEVYPEHPNRRDAVSCPVSERREVP